MNKYLNLVSYFGGKYPHLKWLISKFPAGNFHFIDIMCGSANVALNVDYPLITINDVNNEVINLFKVLREHDQEFFRMLYFTPFSRAELNLIITDNKNEVELDPMERARRYFALCQLSYGANGSQNNHYGTGFEWKTVKSGFYRVDNWNAKLEKLSKIVDKLRTFQIENSNALELFDKVNTPGNIVYFDPPYLLHTRKSKKRYRHEVDESFHHQLAEKLKTAKCFVAVSGYDSPIYDDIFSYLHKTTDISKKMNVGKIDSKECLWTNYDTEKINSVLKIDF